MFDQLEMFADLAPADYRDTLTRTERDTLEAARAILARVVASGPVISSWAALTDYLGVTMAARRSESLRVMYLDRKNRLIRDEETHRGTVDHVPAYPREIARRAIQLDACAVIIAHNHPSGDATPSQSDIAMTKALRDALDALSITLHDHVLTGGADAFSFRANGLF